MADLETLADTDVPDELLDLGALVKRGCRVDVSSPLREAVTIDLLPFINSQWSITD